MSIIAAGNTTTTALVQTADTTGNLVFTTGGANTTALTLSNTQAATFAGNVTITGTSTNTGNASFGNVTATAFSGPLNGTVGATTPAAGTFTSVTSTNARSYLRSSSDQYALGVQYGTATGQFYIGATNSLTPDMIFSRTGGEEKMRIGNNGFVGINTGSPSTVLTVNGNSGTAVTIYGGNQTGMSLTSATNTGGLYIGRGYASDNANTYFIYDLVNSALRFYIAADGSVSIAGSLSKGSGSFRIDHPLPQLEKTHDLVHSFIEGPQADLIYRGVAKLENGKATVNIDTAAGMTEGTFEVLCREVQCFTTNETDWTAVRGSVSGNVLTIEAQESTATSSISWMVIGERKDKHMIDTGWTDENGKVIVEPLRTVEKTMPNPPTTEAGTK